MSEYALIPKSLVFDRSLPEKAKTLYMYLAAREQEWIAQRDIADDLGWSPTTMKQHLDAVFDAGFIDKKKINHSNANYYRLVDRDLK